ncbi:MAG: hypothetical protein MUF04_12345, partial [Akkermansiaceae bacterium]|nr:hypothetical protein [Akkermansiaceae bacterium]
MESYFGALVRVLRGDREGAVIGKAVVALLVVGVAILGLSTMTAKVWAACSDYFAMEEIELPFVCTELADYAGGETAYIFGFGYQPGETVELQVLRADGSPVSGSAYEPWTAVADADGNVSTFWIVCTDCYDSVLRLYALGLDSGLLAETIFSDPISPAVSLNSTCSSYSENF